VLECEGLGPSPPRRCHLIDRPPLFLFVLSNLEFKGNHLLPYLVMFGAQFLVKKQKKMNKNPFDKKSNEKRM
jgi:hypothetical protein